MARCSLYKPKPYPLLSRAELDSLILFEEVAWDWVREVHRHSSNTKKGTNYVLFRNSRNRKFYRLQELIAYCNQNGKDVSELRNRRFKYDKSPDILANRVGANKIAKKQAKEWIDQVHTEDVTEGAGK